MLSAKGGGGGEDCYWHDPCSMTKDGGWRTVSGMTKWYAPDSVTQMKGGGH